MQARPKRRAGRSPRGGTDPRPAAGARPDSQEEERGHVDSATAVAAESIRTGVVPGIAGGRRRNGSSPEAEALTAGDPDDSAFENEYIGEGIPGGNNPTPDQNDVDEIGRAYGLQEEDSGSLRSAAEVLDRRDRNRTELTPPGRRSRRA